MFKAESFNNVVKQARKKGIITDKLSSIDLTIVKAMQINIVFGWKVDDQTLMLNGKQKVRKTIMVLRLILLVMLILE